MPPRFILAVTTMRAPVEPGHALTWAMSRFSIIREFFDFLRERKKWWIAPIVVFLVLLGGLLVFAKGSALAPFIYSLF